MKKKILFMSLILIYLVSRGQEKKLELGTMPYKLEMKEHIPVMTSMLIAGVCEGLMDNMAFHNTSNHPFWGQDSWKNKYYNDDPSQGLTFWGQNMPMFCDGWHLAKAVQHTAIIGAITFKGIYTINGANKKWYWYVFEGVAYWMVNRAGFHIGYKLIKL